MVARVARNLAWGLAWALYMMVLVAVIPAGMLLVRGPHALASYGLTARSLFVSLAIGGLSGGTLVGLCRPLFRRRVAAIVVGSSVGLLGFGAIGVAMFGMTLGAYVNFVPSLIVGGVLGNTWWERNIEPTLPRPPLSEPSPRDTPLGRWRP
jgi:hypothetical protein